MNEIVYAPRIRVSGIVLDRQSDGSYTANVARPESTITEFFQIQSEWHVRASQVPWDVRVGQDWLHSYPKAWEPAN